MFGRGCRAWVVVAVVLSVVAAAGPAALATRPPTRASVSPDGGPPTSSFVVSASGFKPGRQATVYFGNHEVAAADATALGRISVEARVPSSALPGEHTISIRGAGGVARTSFHVRTDWLQFQYDPAHTGHNPHENLLNAGNVDELEVVDVLGGTDRSPPVFAGGRGYLPGAIFDPQTGHMIARLEGGYIESEPVSVAVEGDRVFSSSFYIDEERPSLWGASASTGETLWKKAYGHGLFGPLVSRGIVYTSAGGTIRGVDAATGQLLWEQTPRPRSTFSTLPMSADGKVFVLIKSAKYWRAPSEWLYAFDALTGEILWRRGSTGMHRAPPVFADGMVLTGRGARLAALDPDDGHTLWRSEAACCEAEIAVADGVVFVSAYNFEPEFSSRLRAVDLSTGRILWESPAPFSAGISVANGLVYLSAAGLAVFDAESGEKLFERHIGWAWHPPVVVDGTVYVAIENGPESPPDLGEGVYVFRLSSN